MLESWTTKLSEIHVTIQNSFHFHHRASTRKIDAVPYYGSCLQGNVYRQSLLND